MTDEMMNRLVDANGGLMRDIDPGSHPVLSVTDTGRGMPPEVVARVSEPFLTTKPPGMGTGLGPPMIYGFALQSGGTALAKLRIRKARPRRDQGQGRCARMSAHMCSPPSSSRAAGGVRPSRARDGLHRSPGGESGSGVVSQCLGPGRAWSLTRSEICRSEASLSVRGTNRFQTRRTSRQEASLHHS